MRPYSSAEVANMQNLVRPKIKMEPTRTTKTNPKLVVFPEADIALPPPAGDGTVLIDEATVTGLDQHQILATSTVIQPVSPPTDHPVRRVTAYLTAESYKMRELSDFLQTSRAKSCLGVKRYDEVLYTAYRFFTGPQQILAKDLSSSSSSSVDDEEVKHVPDSRSELLQHLEDAVASSSPVGEVFFFEYGVVVIWGLEVVEERAILEDLRPFQVSPLDGEDVETEEFTFYHDSTLPARLVNDVISLRSGHHLLKLTISHALAQSAKLSYFEELVEGTIISTHRIPHDLALNGTIKMSRSSITKQVGELFVMRMNVNLISNVLDTPELFWSEPGLCPLYRAVRGYLEISQRIEVLNQRCAVISDLLDMLREHSNNLHSETLEWIVIILIGLEIVIGLIHIYISIFHK